MMFAQMFPGMEWIPVMVLTTVIGLGIGAASIAASLFAVNSQFGLQAGRIATWLGVVSPPTFLLLTRNAMSANAYLLLATPALVGAVGVALTRIKSGRSLVLPRAVITVISLAGASAIGFHWWTHAVASSQMMELLKGSREVEVVGFQIDYQQRRVISDDQAVCAYLSAALREAKPPWQDELYGAGDSYEISFRFSSGHEYRVIVGIATNGFSMSIPEANPAEEGYTTHAVVFHEPVPKRLTEIWSFLQQPCESVAGSVMRATKDHTTQIDYEKSLDMSNSGR